MKFVEGQTVGVDLGTTYSAIAQLDETGEPQSLVNADGKKITPSVVLLGDDGHVIVGPSPERMSIEDPRKIVEAIKRQIGNKNFFVEYQGKKLNPEIVSALILKKLKQDAEKTIGPIGNAVVTVPYYFNDVRRKATQDAGQIAGLNIVDIINEPTAATLDYAWQKGELGVKTPGAKEKTILVYDLGGGTFDVTIVRYDPTTFRVLATDGDVMLGGLDWSRRLVDHIAEQFHKKHSLDPREDPETMMTLTQECEDAKVALSQKGTTPVNAYFQGKDLTVSVSRNDFERMTSDLMQRTKDTTELVMQQAGVNHGELDEVVLVGGSTHMPVVHAMLEAVTGKEASKDVIPEEAVAQGAAIHAAILEAKETGGSSKQSKAVIDRLRAITTLDVNSHSLGIKVSDPSDRAVKINHVMVPKNTTVPHEVKQKFVTNVDNQQRVHVEILEGETRDPAGCSLIGDFRVVDLPAGLPKGTAVEVRYSYDKNGRIHAAATVAGKESATEIVRDQGLDDSGIDGFQGLAETYSIQ